jgi:hypothetical protein
MSLTTKMGGVMKKKTDGDLSKKLAQLEFVNDQLVSELAYIDQLMRQVGFSEGLDSLKTTAKELYDNNDNNIEEIDDHSEAA